MNQLGFLVMGMHVLTQQSGTSKTLAAFAADKKSWFCLTIVACEVPFALEILVAFFASVWLYALMTNIVAVKFSNVHESFITYPARVS